ncbi:MAG: response regulator [Bacteroidota bacterium]
MEKLNILIVDDIKLNYIVLKGMLKSTSANVLWASNRDEAVEICNKYNIHLVLMDFQLPDMNGYELSRELKKMHHELPIVFQTANADAVFSLGKNNLEERREMKVLEKPIRRETLLNTVQTYMS